MGHETALFSCPADLAFTKAPVRPAQLSINLTATASLNELPAAFLEQCAGANQPSQT